MRKLLAVLVMAGALATGIGSGQQKGQQDVALQAAIRKETVEGDLKGAIEQYKKIIAQPGTGRATAATALLRMGQCLEKLGETQAQEARQAYERVVREFADQKEAVAEARKRLAAAGAQAETGVVLRKLWTGLVDVAHLVRLSPDGRYFFAGSPYVLHDLTTGEDRPAPYHVGISGGAGNPAMSADGKQVAYGWRNTLKDEWEVRLIGMDGSGMRVLTVSKDSYAWPIVWSPDAKRVLAYISPPGPDKQIAVVSVADGSVLVLKAGPGVFPCDFSPDGQYIVYQQSIDERSQALFLMSADGSREVPLVQGPGRHHDALWAPDGRKVVFVSDRSGTMDLWSVRVADGKPEGAPELLKADIGSMRPLGFTRDGSLCYAIDSSQSDVYVADLDPATGKVTSQPQRITDSFVGKNQAPVVWSSDGQFLAYTRGSMGTTPRQLVIRSVGTGEERSIPNTFPFEDAFALRWFPDGRSLLAPERSSGETRYRRIDIQSGESKSVLVPRPNTWIQRQADLSRDGSLLYYSIYDVPTGEVALIRRNLESGEEKELYRTRSRGSSVYEISLSPDERHVAFAPFTDNGIQLMVVPAEGGTARELCPWTAGAFGMAWTRDGRHLLGVTSLSGPQQLLSVPIDGGAPEPVGLTVRGIRSPSVHPDGRRIAFAGTQARAELWVIKNLLPAPKVAAPSAATIPNRNNVTAPGTIKSVKIGNQIWMSENLNVDRFRNGDPIPEAKTDEEWITAALAGKPAWCYYDNNPENGNKYGKLYNWHAVNDKRGLAPEGWHIPTKAGWQIQPPGEFEILEAAAHDSSNALKAIGQGTGKGAGTNTTGFSALLAGWRSSDLSFDNLGVEAYFWSSTEYDAIDANGLALDAGNNTQYDDPNYKEYGFSVRCIKDWLPSTNAPAVPLTIGQPVAREMKGGDVHTYRVNLEAGQFLRAVFTPHGIDVVVRVLGPDGRQIAEVDGPSGAQGPVPVAVVAKSSGTFLLGVLSFNKNTAAGKYEAKIEELLTAVQYKARLAEEAAKKKAE